QSCAGAVAFLVFLAGAAGARVIAANFCAGAYGLWSFGLCGTCLILQFFFLALLLALHFFCKGRKLSWSFRNACGGARGCSERTRWRRCGRSWLRSAFSSRLLTTFDLHLNVE